jgi:1,4-alpha-glucan branching enzyme
MPRVRFVVECPGAKSVCLAGSFNGWDPTARRMKRVRRGEPTFVAVLDLEPGCYQFKFVADGEWLCCPHARRVPNELGGENSVVEVVASDA